MRDAIAQCVKSMIPVGVVRQPDKSHVSHAVTEGVPGHYSRRPALRLADDEIPESLHTCYRLQFLGIHKICIELD